MANNYFTINPKASVPVIAFYGTFGEGDLTPDAFAPKWRALGNPRKVRLDISSPGGSCFAANAIFDIIARSGAEEVTVYIDGLAASMASLVAMLGTRIIIGANALMMVHNPSANIGGGSADLTRGAALLESIRARMVVVYAKRTGLPEDTIAKMMAEETWMDATTAVRLGFADEVGADLKMAASAFDLTGHGYLHLPARSVPETLQAFADGFWQAKGKGPKPVPVDPADLSDLVPNPVTGRALTKAFHGRHAGRR